MKNRRIEVHSDNGWEETGFQRLKKHNLFRMFESSGEPVLDYQGNPNFLATSDPFLDDSGQWKINVIQ